MIEPNKSVHHDEFGTGKVLMDNGATVLVRFDHGIEECEHKSLTVTRSIADTITGSTWDPHNEVTTLALASAIVSTNDGWSVFSTSRIDLYPHQLWVCHRLTESWPQNWLVADDVGLGKTIEAGLILWPLLSKNLVHRLLIVCPSHLVNQWHYRLRTMFSINITPYRPDMDTETIDFWGMHDQVVASLETLRIDHKGRHQRLFGSDPWDLLIVDEAHHLNQEENTGSTLSYKLVKELVDQGKVEASIFFTGTPHRGKNYNFLSLLQLLRPDRFDPKRPLRNQLPHLHETVIRNNKQCVTDLKGRSLFQPPKVTSATYTYSPEETIFYKMLTNFILEGKTYASTLGSSDSRLVVLVLITMQKLASSSVAAIRRSLSNRLERLVSQRQQLAEAELRYKHLKNLEKEYSEFESNADNDELSRFEEDILSLATGVRMMENEEPRIRELLAASAKVQRETKISKILALIESEFPNRSVLFFTEYKATQSLLMSELARHFGDDSVAFINGDGRVDNFVGCDGQQRIVHQTREAASEYFNSGKVRFLISTEAGGEGIDLQENCHSLVHVDLPWNPMRLHQRVGRLNRIGQKECVEVLKLHNPDTIEGQIHEKLAEKTATIMEAFSSIMEEPEDLLQMVLGMTAPSFFREIHAEAPNIDAKQFNNWFDAKTATFGGDDAVQSVTALTGHAEKFDFQKIGKEVPPVDLIDLRPFFEEMLRQNHRRVTRNEDGSLTFLTPEAWLAKKVVGLKPNYEGMTFDRNLRGKDDVKRILGIGHKVLDQAVEQAIKQPVFVGNVHPTALAVPIIVARVTDRVTGKSSPVKSVVVGVVQSDQGDRWTFLRDWEIVQRLNEVMSNTVNFRKSCKPPEDRAEIESALDRAKAVIQDETPKLTTNFDVPFIEVFAILWPGVEDGGNAQLNEPIDDTADSNDAGHIVDVTES